MGLTNNEIGYLKDALLSVMKTGKRLYGDTLQQQLEREDIRIRDIWGEEARNICIEEKIKFQTENWVEVDEEDDQTFPEEGISVLVSDGINYDVAWYLRSGEYVWKKSNIRKDNEKKFKQFKITLWRYIHR